MFDGVGVGGVGVDVVLVLVCVLRGVGVEVEDGSRFACVRVCVAGVSEETRGCIMPQQRLL